MKRLPALFFLFLMMSACSAALVFTVTRHDDGIRVGADNQLRAATRPVAGKYDLGLLPIFSKTLFYVRENYFDKNRLDPKRMLVGALDFVQRDVPEILIDRWPEHDPKQVTVKVNGQQRSFSIERVDAPWSLRTKLQEIFQFVQPNLQPVPACSKRSIRTRCCWTSRPTRTCGPRRRGSSAAWASSSRWTRRTASR